MYKIKNESGFSLLELLIALGIFMFVLVPVLGVFENNYKSYLVQDEIAETQQNVRVAKMFLERDIRIAGAGLDDLVLSNEMAALLNTMGVGGAVNAGGGKVAGLGFINADGATGSDRLNIYYQDPAASPCDDGSNTSGLPFCDELPQLTLNGGMPVTSPEATVDEELGDAPFDQWDNGCYCGGAAYTSPSFGYMVTVSGVLSGSSPPKMESNLLFVTTVQNTGGADRDRLQNRSVNDIGRLPGFSGNSNASGLPYANKVLNNFDSGTVSFFNMQSFIGVSYFLQDNTLMRQRRNSAPQPLAENIEDFQVAVHVTNADGTERWINNEEVSSSSVNANLIENIDLVRINLLARTSREHDDLPTEVRPKIEDHAAGTTADHFRRRLLQVKIEPRNLGL